MTLGKAILEALDAARDGQPLTAAMILGMLLNVLQERPELSEIDVECDTLYARGEIMIVKNVDMGRLFSVTAKGSARARS